MRPFLYIKSDINVINFKNQDMIIPNLIKEQNRKYCVHEAGHYIVALELGFQCTNISFILFENGTHDGQVGIDLNKPLYSLEDTILYCRNRILVLFAGACAQSIRSNNQIDDIGIDDCLNKNGSNDYAKIREHLRLIGNIEKAEIKNNDRLAYIKHLEIELINETKSLVTKHHEAIKNLGAILLDEIVLYRTKYTLSKDTIHNIDYIKTTFFK